MDKGSNLLFIWGLVDVVIWQGFKVKAERLNRDFIQSNVRKGRHIELVEMRAEGHSTSYHFILRQAQDDVRAQDDICAQDDVS